MIKKYVMGESELRGYVVQWAKYQRRWNYVRLVNCLESNDLLEKFKIWILSTRNPMRLKTLNILALCNAVQNLDIKMRAPTLQEYWDTVRSYHNSQAMQNLATALYQDYVGYQLNFSGDNNVPHTFGGIKYE